MLLYHSIAFFIGFCLDLILGDPYYFPHPIRLIGSLIGKLEKSFLREEGQSAKQKKRKGSLLVLLVCFLTLSFAFVLLFAAYHIHPILGCFLESIMSYQVLATKCLKVESMKVYQALAYGTLEEARYAVSMIVGRDTNYLDEIGVAKAAVETVAENTSDGVIAPMLYLAIGGPTLGFLYKAINTMDSMIGYKNERFLDFGRVAAKLDDVVNYLPSRISAFLMIFSCVFLGKDFNAKKAKEIYFRDRYQHASPNSAQTEAVCAGALGIRLAGDASYFGKKVKKPFIGDELRAVCYEDIKKSCKLLYATAILCEGICLFVLIGIYSCPWLK